MTQVAVIAVLFLAATCSPRMQVPPQEPPTEAAEVQPVAPAPCVIPPGPPCIAYNDPRLTDCQLSVGSCFYVEWEDITGDVIITRARMVLHPTCGDDGSALRLEKAGLEYLGSLQSIPIEVSIIHDECVEEGYLDLTVEDVAL